jgi:hypothetical protein
MRGRLVILGALGYLLYTYAVFAFDAVLNPATPLDFVQVGIFVVATVLGGLLAWLALNPRKRLPI